MSRKQGFSLIACYKFRHITDIPAAFLLNCNVRFVMVDIDNTIAAYDAPGPPDDVIGWFCGLRACGIKLFLVSNSKRGKRVESFAKTLSVDFLMKAGKPSPDGLYAAMKKSGFNAAESAFIGDQIITDILAANRAGVMSVIVNPIRLTNPFFALRYVLELPFRLFAAVHR